jgi:hypothetical protein
MKIKQHVIKLIFSFIALIAIFSCTSLDYSSPFQTDVPHGNLPPSLEYSDKLTDPIFAKLPPEVKTYLQTLSAAFKNRDADFLLAQGEALFAQTVRPHYNDSDYFIMLYRIGGNIWDAPCISDIHHIEYTGWEHGDPVMEIRGRLFYNDAQFVPCVIMLDWKLDDPKIIGIYP